MKFCDMPYERIDVKAATEALDAAAERLSAAKTLEEAEKAFAEREKIISHVQTMTFTVHAGVCFRRFRTIR